MHPSRSRLCHGLHRLVVAAAIGLVFQASAVSAQEVQQLIRQGLYPQALEQIDRQLADKPRDAQIRFMRGVVLTEMGRTQEAVAVFNRLTEDYPELPEPYNNLAVIYAQQKQYDKARQALEKAIRTHPAYATAHENLGDIYARMASQAYDKALQLDSSNATAQTKLSMIKELIIVAARPTPAKPASIVALPAAPAMPSAPAMPAMPPAPKPAEARPTVVATAPAAPIAPATPVAAPAPPAPPPATAAEARPAPVTAAPPPPPAAKPATDVHLDVARMVAAWAADWSHKDVKAYLGHYAADFKTPGGAARSAWELERTQRIRKPGPIQVDCEDIKLAAASGDRATVRFRQNYKSAGLKSSSTKTLELVKRDGRWLIEQERLGN